MLRPFVNAMHVGMFSVLFLPGTVALSAEHRVEVIDNLPPEESLNEAISKKLSTTGVKIIRGKRRTVCEIWLCAEWPVKAGFEPTSEVLYPFRPGQLIGVLRFRRKGADFRDQDISKGVYTLRYGQQPVDGNHEGTSPTRDFLLLVSADEDASAQPMGVEQLQKASAQAARSNHPAMLALQSTKGKPSPKPSIRHTEDDDWWILQITGTTRSGDQKGNLPMELVVAGHANE